MASFYEELNKKKVLVDEIEDVESRAAIDKWIFRLFLVLLGVTPLIVAGHVEEVISPLVSNVSSLASGTKGELFTHYKAIFMIAITVIASILFLLKIVFMQGTIRKTWLNYVLGTFVVVIIVSTIASPNISIALSGQYNRSDGAISWLCYVILMFIAMNIEYPKNFVRAIMYTMMPFVYINLYIITMNFYGKDILMNQAWVQKLVSSTMPEGSSLSEGSFLVGTLNQWNFMSGMFAMMTVMYLAWAITSKKWVETVAGAVTAGAAMLVLFMSLSNSGFLTFVVCLVLLIIVAIRVDKKVMAAVAFVVFFVIAGSGFHILSEKNPRIWTESIGFFVEKNPYIEEVVSFVTPTGNKVYASDATLELPVLPERATSAGSGRMYIWEKTLDISKDRLLLGYGSDSIMYNFPHYALEARSGMYDENTIVDKPHNTYVGALYGFGAVGFAMLVVILGMAIVTTLKTVVTKAWGTFIIGITVCAYFSQAMFNDSLPGVSAIAWLMVGLLFALGLQKKESTIDGRND